MHLHKRLESLEAGFTSGMHIGALQDGSMSISGTILFSRFSTMHIKDTILLLFKKLDFLFASNLFL